MTAPCRVCGRNVDGFNGDEVVVCGVCTAAMPLTVAAQAMALNESAVRADERSRCVAELTAIGSSWADAAAAYLTAGE